MRNDILKLATLAAATLAAGTAFADHNSPMGEGWANMPNDIHNTRIETRDDNETFRDFVRQGAGAESVNRYAVDDNGRTIATGKKATAETGKQNGDKADARERQRSRDASAAERQQRERDRATMRRLEGRALATGPGTRDRSMGGAGRRGRH